jgi:hypothetical protein
MGRRNLKPSATVGGRFDLDAVDVVGAGDPRRLVGRAGIGDGGIGRGGIGVCQDRRQQQRQHCRGRRGLMHVAGSWKSATGFVC